MSKFKIGRIIERVVSITSLVSFVGVLAMMVLNVADVFMTKIFINPITGTYEITQILMLCTVLSSYAYGQIKKTHINMGLIVSHLPKFPKYFLTGINGILSSGTAIIVGIAACQQAQSAMAKGTVTGALFIPWWPFFYVEALAMFIFAVVLIYDMCMAFAALGNNKDIQKYVESSWS